MNNFTRRVYATVGKHFVTLSCLQKASGSREKILIFSGFLVDVSGAWFYITAGHILRDIKKAIEAGSVFSDWRLDDQTAGNKFNGAAIPFDFDIEAWLVVEDEQIGLDYATTLIGGLYRLALQAGGAVPIGKAAWGDYVTEHDAWVLVGVPSESVEYDGSTIITGRIVVTPIEPADEPAMAGLKAQNQFYGRLKEDSTEVVQDIDGMSGGPIFALKKIGEEWRYCVIGVQSSWYPNSRIIAACPFSSLGNELLRIVESIVSSPADAS